KTRPGHIRELQRNPGQIAEPDIFLSSGLGDAVAGEGAGRMLDRYRHALRSAIAQRRLEIDEALDDAAPRRFDRVDRANDVGHDVLAPVARVPVCSGA